MRSGRAGKDLTEHRRRAERRGKRGERLAAWLLRLKGYSVLARRYRAPGGEVDLIAARGSLVVFVEVKVRRHQGEQQPDGWVTARQWQRIANAAEQFLANPRFQRPMDVRFDVVLVGAGGFPQHHPDAWRPDGSH